MENKGKESGKSMINLIKSEFYKLRKDKSFYILLAVSMGFALLMAFAFQGSKAMAVLMPDDPDIKGIVKMAPNFSGAWFMGYSLSTDMQALIISIFVSIFVTTEFGYGPMKNIVAKGFNRTKVYIAKLITSAVAGLLMLFAFMVTGGIAGTIMWGFDPSHVASLGKVLLLFLDQGMLIVAYAAVFVFVSMSLRGSGASIGANICVVMLFSTLLLALNALFGIHINIADYWLSGNVKLLATLNPATPLVVRGLIVAVAYTVVATVAGCVIFKKQDIK